MLDSYAINEARTVAAILELQKRKIPVSKGGLKLLTHVTREGRLQTMLTELEEHDKKCHPS